MATTDGTGRILPHASRWFSPAVRFAGTELPCRGIGNVPGVEKEDAALLRVELIARDADGLRTARSYCGRAAHRGAHI